MATIRDVARSAGVSTATVSHVLNLTRHVSPITRDRVLRAIAALNYQPNRVARSLRNRKTTTLGVLLPNSANPFFAELLHSIESCCFDLGYSVILGNANDDPKRELFYLDVLLSKQVDGILLVSTGAYKEVLEIVTRRRVPTVMIDRPAAEPRVDTVYIENEQGGRIATEYLLSLGHRAIAVIGDASPPAPTIERMAGYRSALRAAGLAVNEGYIVTSNYMHEGGYRACQQLLHLPERPTAIFACNDMMAIGALCAIHGVGLRVPQDISVIGFDDISLASYTVPRLTTIAQPLAEIGRIAVEYLLQRLNSPDAPLHQKCLPVALVERDSCQRLLNATGQCTAKGTTN
jgi:LacI family transcriptional regulator